MNHSVAIGNQQAKIGKQKSKITPNPFYISRVIIREWPNRLTRSIAHTRAQRGVFARAH
jgi:hypothetical protein